MWREAISREDTRLPSKPIGTGRAVVKYGQVIGYASAPIAAGDHVHTHNVEMREVELHHAF